MSRWGLRRVNRLERRPFIFYVHPWEIDPEQPRIAGVPLKSRLRHYINLARVEARLRRLLAEFRWDRVDKVFLSDQPQIGEAWRLRIRVEPLDDTPPLSGTASSSRRQTPRSFTAPAGRTVIERSFGHGCHFLQARCDGRITGVLPLVHVSSRLFGNALISNAYGVYGGPVASDEASLQALNKPPYASPLSWVSTISSIDFAPLPSCPGPAIPASTRPSASAWSPTPRRL